MSLREIKRDAWKAYKANYKNVLLMQLVLAGISLAVAMILNTLTMPMASASMSRAIMSGTMSDTGDFMSMYGSLYTLNMILNLIVGVLMMPLQIGVTSFYLKNIRGSKPTHSEIFGYYKSPVNIILTYLLKIAAIFAAYFVVAIVTVLAMGLCFFFLTLARSLYIVIGFIGIVILILAVLAIIFICVRLSLTNYILADEPTQSPSGVIGKSWNLSKGHVLRLVLLGLSFIGWFLLPIIITVPIVVIVLFAVGSGVAKAAIMILYVMLIIALFVVYYFVLYPYIYLSFARYYESLVNKGITPTGDGKEALIIENTEENKSDIEDIAEIE